MTRNYTPTIAAALSIALLANNPAQAAKVITNDNGYATSIWSLEVEGKSYDVAFVFDSFLNIWGDPEQPNFKPPIFWRDQVRAEAATRAINEALNRQEAIPPFVSDNYFFDNSYGIPYDFDETQFLPISGVTGSIFGQEQWSLFSIFSNPSAQLFYAKFEPVEQKAVHEPTNLAGILAIGLSAYFLLRKQ